MKKCLFKKSHMFSNNKFISNKKNTVFSFYIQMEENPLKKAKKDSKFDRVNSESSPLQNFRIVAGYEENNTQVTFYVDRVTLQFESDYFTALFTSGMKESQKNVLYLNQPSKFVEIFLRLHYDNDTALLDKLSIEDIHSILQLTQSLLHKKVFESIFEYLFANISMLRQKFVDSSSKLELSDILTLGYNYDVNYTNSVIRNLNVQQSYQVGMGTILSSKIDSSTKDHFMRHVFTFLMDLISDPLLTPKNDKIIHHLRLMTSMLEAFSPILGEKTLIGCTISGYDNDYARECNVCKQRTNNSFQLKCSEGNWFVCIPCFKAKWLKFNHAVIE
jgi:hypothetical protein